MRDEFKVHLLNETGLAKAHGIALAFSDLLVILEDYAPPGSREMAIVRTKLQEAAFFAKRAMAIQPENQKAP